MGFGAFDGQVIELGHEEDVGVHGVAFEEGFEVLSVELAGGGREQGADLCVVEFIENPGAFVVDSVEHVLDELFHVFEREVPFQFAEESEGFPSGVGGFLQRFSGE
jgi:hypothetical protein